ncbi:SOS response-associated peptidase [Nakamurella antarctica]|uniref:Abasic site processing protein n=1 Tax=Nakamurella antarctica TaxID=1902245 RepID=A0A3G8ZQS3_9ACTN|nr:SOS response-associated peptidase [Nakamurella antarctica]AZI59155.1 SOS response-associated peptidase [Nakamurella antarctica]
MCGRYVSTASDGELFSIYGTFAPIDDAPAPSWNVAPTDSARVLLERFVTVEGAGAVGAGPEGAGAETVRQVRSLRWGLVPSWSKDAKSGARMINARVETILEKPAFRQAARKRRAIVPAAGYYEWQKSDDGKVPFFLHSADGGLLSFAGLYELWPDPSKPADADDRWVWTFTVITKPATDALGYVHDRSPVIVPGDLIDSWLDPAIDGKDEVAQLITAIPEPHLVPVVVSSRVNSVRNNGPGLIEEAAPEAGQQELF